MMDADLHGFVEELLAISPSMASRFRELLSQWGSEPPSTFYFGLLGDAIVDDFTEASEETNRRLLSAVESALRGENDDLQIVVTTGLIEGAVTQSRGNPEVRSRFLSMLGPLSRFHADAWLAEC